MNIADKLRKVLEIKNNIKAALEEKGIENVSNDFSTFAENIANIKGGGDEPESEIEILPDEPPVVEIPEVPEIEPWVQPEDWIDLKAKIERHSYEEYPYRIALLLQYDKTDTIVLGTTGDTTCKCITVDDGDRGLEYDVEEGNYAITHSWDGYTGTNGYRWVIYHFDTPEANFINFPTSTVQAIFDGINASLSGRMMSSSSNYSSYSIRNTRMVSMESINGGSIKNVTFKDCRTIKYISPNIFGNNSSSTESSMFSGCYNLEYSPILDATGKLNFSDLFYNCYNLKYVSPIINIDRATNFYRMFYSCYSLTTIPELNTTNGTNFSNMFYSCYSLTTIPELNTTNGTNFSNMFQNCSSLTTIPLIDTTNGTSFSYMFSGCSSLVTIPELNTSNGTDFSYMFSGCSSLRYIHQLNFPKAGSSSLNSMFYCCTNLRTVIGINAPEAYNTSSLFYSCPLLRYVGKLCLGDTDLMSKLKDLSRLEYIEIDVPKGKTLTELFYGCSKLKKIILNAPLCTAAINMFYNCSSLKEIIITPETFSQCTTFNSMFQNCSSLTSIPLIDTTNGTDFTKMFYYCKSLKSIPELNTTNGTTFYYMFNECSSLTTIPLIDTTNGTDFSNMFWKCSSLKSIPELNTPNGTNFNGMFYNCSSLTSIPLIDTTNGTSFSSMFNSCYSLTTIPELNTSNSTDFRYMFQNCSSLTTIPLIDTTNGTNFGNMFQNCYSLTTIPELNTTNGTNFSNMFNSCYSLTTIPELNTTNGKDFSYMFQNCYSLTSIPNLNFEKATNISYLCNNSKNLSAVPLIYAPSITSSYGSSTYCFEGCGSIKKFGGFKLPNTTGVRTLFSSNAPSIRDLGVWDLSNITGSCDFPITNVTDSLKIEGRVNYTINKSYYITYVLIRNLEIESIEKDQNFSYWTNLTKQSLLNILNALVTLEEGVTKTLTLHTTYHMGILTDEEKAIATNKGWTLSEYNA